MAVARLPRRKSGGVDPARASADQQALPAPVDLPERSTSSNSLVSFVASEYAEKQSPIQEDVLHAEVHAPALRMRNPPSNANTADCAQSLPPPLPVALSLV